MPESPSWLVSPEQMRTIPTNWFLQRPIILHTHSLHSSQEKISMKICETNYSLMFTQDTSHSLQFYIFHAFCNKECNWIVCSPCTHYAGLYSLFSILYNNSFTKLFFLIDASCCTNDNHCVPRGPSYVGGSYSLSPQGAKVLLCLCNNQLMLKKLYLWCKNY